MPEGNGANNPLNPTLARGGLRRVFLVIAHSIPRHRPWLPVPYAAMARADRVSRRDGITIAADRRVPGMSRVGAVAPAYRGTSPANPRPDASAHREFVGDPPLSPTGMASSDVARGAQV